MAYGENMAIAIHSENVDMTLSLPDPISTYFEISNGKELGRITQIFAHDAEVSDEGRTHRGHDAIESWQAEAQRKFTYTVEPVSVSRDDSRLVITATVAGDFPGSPVQLEHVFSLDGNLIQSLKIS